MRASAALGRTSKPMHAAASAQPDVASRAPEDEQRIGMRSGVAERVKGVNVAIVRGCRQQEDVGGARRERSGGGAAIAVAGGAVRFVDDQNVPPARPDRPQHVRPFDEIDGGDGDRQRGPGIHADRQRRHTAPQVAEIRRSTP